MDYLTSYKNYIVYGVGLVCLYSLRKYFNGPKTYLHRDLKGKIIILTGASEGIGKQTALQLLDDGAIVIFACRDEKKTLSIIDQLDKKVKENAIYINLDLSSFKSVLAFVKEFKKRFNRLDILINNAASCFKSFDKTEDGIERTLQVNTISPYILTTLLFSIIKESDGRVINVSSKGYRRWVKESKYYDEIDINKSDEYSGLTQYCYSKLGNIYFTQDFNEHCKENNINVRTASLHPGVINTELGRDYKSIWFRCLFFIIFPLFWFFTKTQKMGSQTTLHLCYLKDEDFKSGEYYSDCKVQTLEKHALDKNARISFMNLVRKYISQNKEISNELGI